jgi:hypothetical protein
MQLLMVLEKAKKIYAIECKQWVSGQWTAGNNGFVP